jgi:hypothetical protein
VALDQILGGGTYVNSLIFKSITEFLEPHEEEQFGNEELGQQVEKR